MNPSISRGLRAALALMLAIAGAAGTRAEETGARALGPHPAIVVQRLHQSAGYDYAAQFYPHPAGLRLYLRPPGDAAALRVADAVPGSQPLPPVRRPGPGRLRTRVQTRDADGVRDGR